MPAFSLIVGLLVIFSQFDFVSCSAGDRSQEFRRCLLHCSLDGCAQVGKQQSCDTLCFNDQKQSKILQYTGWDCMSDCKYACMHLNESWRRGKGYTVTYKYYGKWPFKRVFGCQEICSVIFSFGNLVAHAFYLSQLGAWINKANSLLLFKVKYPFGWIWWLSGLCAICSWFWSAVFHCRDVNFTEKMDYIFADISVAMLLVAAFVRITGDTVGCVTKGAGISIIIGGVTYHLYRMLYEEFDYGFNIKVNVCLGILQSVVWMIWVHFVNHPGRQTMYLFLVLVNVSMLLEILDFPPLQGYLDAHALWHLVTIPLIALFYRFVDIDIQFMVKKEKSV